MMKHRVPRGRHVVTHRDTDYQFGNPNIRFSVSFRKVNRTEELPADTLSGPTLPRPPPTPPSLAEQKPARRGQPAVKPIVLIAGGSFPNRLDAERLAGTRKKQTVINIAKGGRTIPQVERDIVRFVAEHPEYRVTKLIVSVGTNDVRYCKSKADCAAIKPTLRVLMERVKALLPDCKIWFQSLLPIVDRREFTTQNMFEMNKILYDLCIKNSVYFIDAFSKFLDFKGFRNHTLFHKFDPAKPDIHPNKVGLGVLARCYIYVIRNNKFNPLGY